MFKVGDRVIDNSGERGVIKDIKEWLDNQNTEYWDYTILWDDGVENTIDSRLNVGFNVDLEVEKIVHTIKNNNNETRNALRVHNEVSRILTETNFLKPINKHSVNRIKKEHPDWNVVIQDQHDLFYICVSGGDSGFNYATPLRLFIGYNKDAKSFNPDLFEENDACNCKYAINHQKSRIRDINRIDDIGKLLTLRDKYRKAEKEMRDLLDTFIDSSWIEKEIGL